MRFVLNKCGLPPDLPDLPQEPEPGDLALSEVICHPAELPDLPQDEEPSCEPVSPSNPPRDFSRTLSEASFQTCGEDIGRRLMLAKRQALLRERRLKVPAVVISLMAGAVALILRFYSSRSSPFYFLAGWSVDCCAFVGLLGLLPSDRRIVPLLGRFLCAPIVLGFAVLMANEVRKLVQTFRDDKCVVDNDKFSCWFVIVLIATRCIDFTSTVLPGMRLVYMLALRLPSDLLLSIMIFWFGFNFLALGTVAVIRGLAAVCAGLLSHACIFFATGVGHIFTGYVFVFAPDFRSSIQSWLMSQGRNAITAAGISELLGGQPIRAVIDSARSTFFFVPADVITRHDMADNHPNPALSRLTRKGGLGSVDAFVSHSWHDNAAAKWVGLQQLRNAFKERHSREPKLWIDKYCINQNEIAVSLACVPVYLSGCSELWILCGKTYLERLWCIMEVLIFMEMGGQISQLHVKLLGEEGEGTTPGGASSRPNSSLLDDLEEFDARNASCTTQHDTDKLRSVLDATGHERITKVIRDVFKP